MTDTTVLTMSGNGATNATTNAVAAIDVPQDGILLGVDMSLSFATNFTPVSAAREVIRAELSFISTNQFDVNDRRGALAEIAAAAIFLTSGATALQANKYVMFGDGIRVAGGERLYVHTLATDGPSCLFSFMIMFRAGRRIGRRSARRS